MVMIKKISSKSKCLLTVCLFGVYTSLIQATSAVQNSSMSSLRQEGLEHEGYNTFEGNVTLQKLVKDKYGVGISELLDLFSGDTDKDDVMPWVLGKNGLPDWESTLLVHLINDETKKSKRELTMTPETYVDDGKWYIEFNCEAFLRKKDVLICRDTRRAAANDNGPWVWPSATVIRYNDTTPVELTCWAWLHRFNFISWVQKGGVLSNTTSRLSSLIQKNKYSYIKLELSEIFTSADNGSELLCTRENGKIYKSTPIILVYEGHKENLGLWCGLSVVLMAIAVLAATCACALAVVNCIQRRCSHETIENYD